jgi:hypothetical protein
MVLAHWARGAVVDPHDQILSQGVMINLHPNHEQKRVNQVSINMKENHMQMMETAS